MTLRVVVEVDNPNDSRLTYAVDSPQTFICKSDPADSDQWVIFRQYDRPRDGKTGTASEPIATKSTSWGAVKRLIR